MKLSPEVTDQILAALRAVSIALFAAIAGALGYTMRTMDAHEKVNVWRMLLEFCASGFVGFLVMLLCRSRGISLEITAVCVGVSGWLGASVSIKLLEKAVERILQINRSDDDDEPRQAQ